jgi:hypothetical protein
MHADPIVERTLAVTRSLRSLAAQLMERAYQKRDAGELSMEDFLGMEARHQEILNQANTAIYQATDNLASIAEEFHQVEDASKELDRLQGTLKTISDVLAVSAQLLMATSALALLVLDPNPGTVAATANALYDVARTIRDTSAR